MSLDVHDERQALLIQWNTWLELPSTVLGEMRVAATPDGATAQRWLHALAVGANDDPGDLRLRLALCIATEAPTVLEDLGTREIVSAFATRWAEQVIDLAQQERAAHAEHLLKLSGLINTLPNVVMQTATERLWRALDDDDNWRGQQIAQRALALLPAHLDDTRVRQMVEAHDNKTCVLGLSLAGLLGDRAPIAAMLVALRRDATKWEAARALIALGDAAPLPPLLDVATHHPNPNMREAMITALSALSYRLPHDDIIPLIQDNNPRMLLSWADHLPIMMLVNGLFLGDYALNLLLPAVLARRNEVPLDAIRERLRTTLQQGNHSLYGAHERYAAARILHAFGEPVDPAPLVETIKLDPHDGSRTEGIGVLGMLGERAPLDELMGMLADEGYMARHLRMGAAVALGTLGDRVPLAPLIALLADGDSSVRRAAIEALCAQGPRVPITIWHAELTGEWPIYALLALAAYDAEPPNDAVVQGIWRLQRSPMRGMRWGSSTDAEQIFAKVLRAWRSRLTPERFIVSGIDVPEMRQVAAAVLGAVSDAAAVDALLVATADGDALVRMAAIRALGTRAPLAVLRQLAADDPEGDVRAAATAILGQLAARPVEALLAKCLAPERADRVAALRALGREAPSDLLLANLTDERQQIDLDLLDLLVLVDAPAAYQAVMDVRQRTGRGHLRAWGHLGALAPLDILREALIDNSYYNSGVEAVEALLDLGQLNDDADPDMLAQVGEVLATATDLANQRDRKGDRDFDTYIDLLRLIRRLPPVAGMAVLAAFARGSTVYSFNRPPARLPEERDLLGIITKTITSREEWVRASAGLVLLHWRNRLPLEPIIAALQDLDDAVRPLAAWLLGYVGDASVLPFLQVALDDPASAHPAAVALRRLGVADVAIPTPSADFLRRFEPPLNEDEDETALTPLLALETQLADLSSQDIMTRLAAITALGRYPAVPAERLIWLLGDSTGTVGTEALTVLRAHAPAALQTLLPAAVATLRGMPTGVFASLPRVLCADLLAGIRADAQQFVDMLLDLLAWPYFEVRVHALRALPALTGSLPGSLIMRVIALRHDPIATVRVAAEDTLATLVASTTS